MRPLSAARAVAASSAQGHLDGGRLVRVRVRVRVRGRVRVRVRVRVSNLAQAAAERRALRRDGGATARAHRGHVRRVVGVVG